MKRIVALVVAVVALLAAGSALAARGFRWSAPALVDHTAPFGDPITWSSVSCPSSALCVNAGTYLTRTGDELSAVASTRMPAAGASDWKTAVGIGPGSPVGVSCPFASLCVTAETAAVEGQANAVAASANPTGGRAAWRVTRLPAALLAGISCPTVSLCVAVDGGVGDQAVFTSTKPGGASPAWKKTRLSGGNSETILNAISCTPSLLCVAVGDDGLIAVSTNPTGGPSAWTFTTITGASRLVTVACPSASLCVAADASGVVATSTNPTGGASAWKTIALDPPSEFGVQALACTAATFCVAADSQGRMLSSTNPAGGAAAWNVTSGVDASEFSGLGCASSSLCVATDAVGGMLVSTLPGSTPAPWTHPAQLNGTTALGGVSCPSASLCVAVDGVGRTFTTTHPARPRAWRAATIAAAPALGSVSCPRSTFCVAVGADDALATTTDPRRGTAGWSPTQLRLKDYQGNNRALSAISCASPSLCVATADEELAVSSHPSGGPAAWRSLPAGDPFDGTYIGNEFDSVSCPSAKLCVAGDNIRGGGVVVSTTPRTARAWRFVRLHGAVTGVSCPNARFCAGVDRSGRVLTTTRPTGRARTWRAVRIDRGHALEDVSCTSSRFCAVIDAAGHAFISTNPRGGAGAWKRASVGRRISPVGVPAAGLAAISCPSSRMCVVTDYVGNVIVGAR